jgi:alpha-tubulin suppressor-like RCC1 family protein
MPTFYNFTQNGVVYSFDDVFVPSDLFRDGNLFAWGNGGNGRLGNAVTTNTSTPVTTFSGGANWKQVSSGNNRTSAIKTDGTLWIWGLGNNGELGTNSVGSISTPVTTFAGGNNWKQVGVGNNQTAAIKTDGTLWVWGGAAFGALGTNDTTPSRSTPVTTFVGGTNWKQVSVGDNYMSAIKTDGTLWTWGFNNTGQLGTNDITNRSTPVTTFAGGTNWKQVSSTIQQGGGAGTYFTAAIKTDGTLWVWGNGGNGRLGNAVTTNTSTPVTTFAGGNNWKQVDCGYSHIAAIKTDGTLWTWGLGTSGRLGNAVITGNISTPITTFSGGTNWKQVSAREHTAAIKTDGTLWVWGSGFQGRLGNAITTGDISTPVTTFAGGTNWKQLDCALNHTAALTYQDPGI